MPKTIKGKRSTGQPSGEQAEWPAWPQPEQHQALTERSATKTQYVYRGISLKFHKITWRRAQNLLWAAKHNTNLISAILENLREDYLHFREDGAFESIHQLLLEHAERIESGQQSGMHVRRLIGILEGRFVPPDDAVSEENDSFDDSRTAQMRPAQLILEPKDFPIIWTLRRGAFAQAALPLLLFYIKIQRYLREQAHKLPPHQAHEDQSSVIPKAKPIRPESEQLNEELTNADEDEAVVEAGYYPQSVAAVPNVQTLHQMWADAWQRYQQSAKRKIPFSRDRGKLFGEALATQRIRRGKRQGRLIRTPGKRRVRWLRDQLFSVEQVLAALTNVHVLLHTESFEDDAVNTAKAAHHLWRNDENYHKSPRADHYSQYRRSSKRAKTALVALHYSELVTYESELLEKLDHAREFDLIRADVDIYLNGSPPSYPTVEPTLFNDAAEQRGYQRALEDVRSAFKKAAHRQKDKPLQKAYQQSFAETMRHDEFQATTNLLQAESDVSERALLPLNYKRTMRPPKPNPSFALLYEQVMPDEQKLRKKFAGLREPEQTERVKQAIAQGAVYRYLVALVVHHNQFAFVGDNPADYFAPKIEPGRFFYVNFPDVVFVPPSNTSFMTFQLECGDDYQNKYLREFIEHQRQTQRPEETDQNGEIQPTLPKNAGIGEAKVVIRQNGRKWYSFFLHFSVPVRTPTEARPPAAILGVTCVEQRYFWALLDLNGQAMQSGELTYPRHVQPRESTGVYSANYPPAIAHAVYALADETNALIGIDKTWERKRAIAQAGANRKALLHPDRKVADAICNNALEMGLARPWLVYGISPNRCGQCGNKEQNERQLRGTLVCSACGSAQLTNMLSVPLAFYNNDTLIATTRWEHNDVDHAHATTDFLAWIIGKAPHEKWQATPLAESVQHSSLITLEMLTSDGRQMFHHRRILPSLVKTTSHDYQPRKRRASIRIAAPAQFQQLLVQLVSAYATLALTVHVELLAYEDNFDLVEAVFENDVDIVIHGRNELALHTSIVQRTKTSVLCTQCGRVNLQRERWFVCASQQCRNQERDGTNRARLVARLALNQLVSAYNQPPQEPSTEQS